MPVNVGQNNFDRIRYEYFADRKVAFEAFKAGVFTFREEFTSAVWATQYNFAAVKDGRVVTSFRSIDGAMSLKLIFADGKEVRTDKVAGVNRYQDWVLIPLEDQGRPGLTLVSKKSSAGDHCYWLDVKPDGTVQFLGVQVMVNHGYRHLGSGPAGPELLSRLDRHEGKQLTQAGAIVGTPEFMPPEQARGDRVDHRADIYAVGTILYNALTGQKPFERLPLAQKRPAVGAPETALGGRIDLTPESKVGRGEIACPARF